MDICALMQKSLQRRYSCGIKHEDSNKILMNSSIRNGETGSSLNKISQQGEKLLGTIRTLNLQTAALRRSCERIASSRIF